MKITAALVALIAISIVAAYSTYGALSTNQTLASTGNIKVSPGLAVYQDSACTVPLTSINWGTATPGSAITQTVYVKNTGQGASLALNMTTSSWAPTSANGPIAISWNLESTRLYPGQSAAATLTASISSTITDITNFNVQITITGTQ